MTVKADKPIQTAEEDVLGRQEPARAFAEQLLCVDPSSGIVAGVLGPWGSGKTSFINLVRAHLNDLELVALDFNPWMFSGTDQLVNSFFTELSAQLKLRPGLAQIGQAMEDYGELFSGLAWLPIVGPWIDRGRKVTKTLGKVLQRRKGGIDGPRAAVEKALAALDRPIVVIVDDIDRLTGSEIREIFKLVRLTANFPNVIYIVAFDRMQVEEALAEKGLPGREYLEKILQITVDLPAVPRQNLRTQILSAVEEALSEVDNTGPFDEDAWADVFVEIILPLITNMRDIRRYAAAVLGTVRGLNGQVALVDVLALEAVRVFLPDVFGRMHASVEALTATSAFSYSAGADRPYLPQIITAIDHIFEFWRAKARGDQAP